MTLITPTYATTHPPETSPVVRTFKRRECLPMIQNLLWKIDTGMVRSITLHEEGDITTLGLWGAGDIIGHLFAGIEPYQAECLGTVRVHRLLINDYQALEEAMWCHIQQSQALLTMQHGSVQTRFSRFLNWLADRFGQRSGDECFIPLPFTHQDIAEVIGSSRVTVTRLIGEFEREDTLSWSKKGCVLRHHSGPQTKPVEYPFKRCRY
ncbi:Crp/Fnr family transcriptional regulator [Acaryochloris sp. CCMEE 5410]|uniref:Crp/Fnr family transcriptional regulator n=1 Tax=Acaryochloris sp. CCMEE 5410 TaxID=310037 RepID=UPI0002484107|nr:Crp/Fnr family transcriptional regulator [Acaryochloris sp. CCMEE 5410]KAI9134778.1 Crp/Fnr family transcriptional regulator [Acaryochloris sp. CCMEE 5410]